MRFWDSSAILPLFAREAHSDAVEALVADDSAMIVWWAAHVECASAVHRLRREGVFSPAEAVHLLARLTVALDAAEVVQPGEELSSVALRLLATHPLRAADALQLAAALVWSRGRPDGREFVCLDERLSTAALLEGFTLLPAFA
ncbi:MAG TPA: PIN domain-containing protein [Thermoleophilia bacterium]|nr:PIN domain-containing protein [Thermoleophilia bacterium]